VEHRVGIGHRERIAGLLRLEEHRLDPAIAHEHRVAPRALAEVEVALVDETIASVNTPLPSGRSSTFSASWSLPHSAITNGSLTETHTIWSMPCSLHTAASSL